MVKKAKMNREDVKFILEILDQQILWADIPASKEPSKEEMRLLRRLQRIRYKISKLV